MIDYYVNLATKPVDTSDTASGTTHYHLLAAKEQKQDAIARRTQWGKQQVDQQLHVFDQSFWSIFSEPAIDLARLPAYTVAIQFTFTLAQPYLSKDDNPFYIIDNPIVRDKVFRLPMVRPSSWKGSLRRALWQQGHQDDGQERRNCQIQRLFGDANDDDERGQSGRLIFYPTFFTKTSLEIINPHNRTTRVGKNPILLESVPAGATGTFTLLYVPLNRIGNENADPTRQLKALPEEVADDLKLVVKGVQAMMTVYGFGAKTSSGFGLAEAEFAKDQQSKAAARIQIKGGKALRPSSFRGLCQAADRLATELNPLSRGEA